MEIAARKMFEDQKGLALPFLNVVKHGDMRMIERRDDARFAEQAFMSARRIRQMRRQKFDGYQAIEAGVAGFIHNPHAALAEFLKYLVMDNRAATDRD